MTVLIAGAGGQLGLDLIDAFAGHTVVGLRHDQLDITDEAAVWDAVTSHAPAVVVNAAAWTDVDGCETDPHRAHRINALGPWWLARACASSGATLVHVSSDYVFDGVAPTAPSGEQRGFTEFDAVAPINVYGRTKVASEQLIRQTLASHHIVRTAWVNGARGRNFVRTMLRLGAEERPIRVVDDQIGSPTFTRDLALAIRELAVTGRYGTVNRTNAGRCSWHEFADAVFTMSGLEVDLAPQPSSALERPAPRPAWSVLDPTHAIASGLSELPDWRRSLGDLLAEIAPSGFRSDRPAHDGASPR